MIPLDNAVIVAIITGGAAIISNILTARSASKEMDHKLQTHQAVTDTKLEELTREVREHNGFARRMPVLEEQMRVANHRIGDLEGYHKPKE